MFLLCWLIAHVASTAINWLATLDFVHGDISDGNILLAQEEPSCFRGVEFREITSGGKLQLFILCRRGQESQGAGVYGILHDLDMVGSIKQDDIKQVSLS